MKSFGRARAKETKRRLRGCEMKLRSLGFSVFSAPLRVNAFLSIAKLYLSPTTILNVRVEPEQQRLGVRGKITLRNDSATPQKIAVLQISSSLDWRSIRPAASHCSLSRNPTLPISITPERFPKPIVTLPEAVRAQRHGRSGDRLRGRDRARCDAAHADRNSRGAGEQFRLGPDQREIHGRARSGICGLVSDRHRGRKSFRRQRAVRGCGQMEGARGCSMMHLQIRGAQRRASRPSCCNERKHLPKALEAKGPQFADCTVPAAGAFGRADVCDGQL
jgi:hypothetical protein